MKFKIMLSAALLMSVSGTAWGMVDTSDLPKEAHLGESRAPALSTSCSKPEKAQIADAGNGNGNGSARAQSAAALE